MNYWKKFNDWYDSKPKNPKLYLIIGIIFFVIGGYIAGTQGGGLVNGITQVISASLGIICLLKYFYSGKK